MDGYSGNYEVVSRECFEFSPYVYLMGKHVEFCFLSCRAHRMLQPVVSSLEEGTHRDFASTYTST